MQAETLAALMGLGGAIVGAGLSTGAVIWQQRKTAHEAERMHLSGLAEAAANECIKISYALHKHFAEGVPDRNSSAYFGWGSAGEELCRALEEQALRFHDKAVRDFLERCHAEMYVRPDFVAAPEPWPPRYVIICTDIRTVMGTVLRRQPFPKEVWEHYPAPS
ncbi:hypothetical protein O1Q96_01455 (plasmid) [Streptomyces sp. Qhu-G9]|uniref:hypothetical protein n=1 Tax=Streptomyces sp. Qhu-G9 TaxID=3452799 RepID=UPI0022AC0CB0|nr:hypothetical protein [Streptomyces aurantiacus]WAU78521.1 hypothetical protein O1Q96_01455 [Streptomyces aurantiacus]